VGFKVWVSGLEFRFRVGGGGRLEGVDFLDVDLNVLALHPAPETLTSNPYTVKEMAFWTQTYCLVFGV